MATVDDAHRKRWTMIVSEKVAPYNPEFGIPTFWRQHPEIGSPLGPEIDLGDGVTVQAFTGGVLKYVPGQGVELVQE